MCRDKKKEKKECGRQGKKEREKGELKGKRKRGREKMNCNNDGGPQMVSTTDTTGQIDLEKTA